MALTDLAPLINVTLSSTGIPVIDALQSVLKVLYVLLGGLVGISILMLFLRWRELYLLRKRMSSIEASVAEISRKLDALTAMVKRKK